ncbi:1,2-phenylacetyl-CoA epoxidase subunit PaaD [Nocardiopsis sp. NRRL B-16309]|uniref:1,2-phenylacetyl-CoA epoxidase subunit PaaD n=1 Tax=Nocardiopsis sp. NRRL B-16309 TaxID=1519494 RepID=UPI0006AF36A8|nr:1,2-phenylacetyl-CoA epoxidase subunit PaaD [Nocardiopsis sp. NRRL B-16309]KOX13381.1 phenylacetic acid degradation protein PaaD [Nocardiopsis sp. NRRL B-16309]
MVTTAHETGRAAAHAGPTAGDRTAAERARAAAAAVADPELPMLTLADLGILRGVDLDRDGTVQVWITPTYSGCPALAEMRADVDRAVRSAGFDRVRVRMALSPAWTTDWITEEGRAKLAEHGISPPGRAPRRAPGPVPLTLLPTRTAPRCPLCGAADTEELSRFGATSCKSLHRCRSCLEPFEHVKEI